MFENCLAKQKLVKELFDGCNTPDSRYQKIIEVGKMLPPLDPKYKISDNIVKGCQSIVHLHSELVGDVVHFEVSSDAMISLGLAALLVRVYDGETPETILKCPPTYLEELGIAGSLTPNRANGLYSMHLRMKQDALKLLMQKN
jgi:cysteine desulfuration protein SufE